MLGTWQDLRLDEHSVEDHFQLLGEPSGDIVDVDVDSPEALAAAETFLPATGLVHGRRSKPRSHRYYVASGTRTQKFEYADGKKKTMLIELRSTGSQTIVPPSVHPSGEFVTWEDDGTPAIADAATLRRQVAFVATTALLARSWPAEGVRHDLSLGLAGLLLRLGVSEADSEAIISTASRVSGDTEWADRGAAARYTAARISSGDPATGAPTVEHLLEGNGSRIVATIRRWLQDPTTSTISPTERESELPEIDATDLNLPIVSTAALEALQARNTPPFIFRFGNQIDSITGR